jgi:tripartite ATP-independent transporter DctP family solute receptor
MAMVSRIIRCLCLGSCLFGAVEAVAQQRPARPTPAPAPEVKVLRLAHQYNEEYAWHRSFERFRDVLKAKTGGALDVQIFARGTLGSELECVSRMRRGTLDGAIVSTAAVATVAPEVAFLDLMYLWKDREHWRQALDGDVGRRMSEAIRVATTKGGVPGFEVLGYWGGAEMHVLSRTRGYRTLADLADVKIRVQDSPVQIESWKLLGTQPTSAIAYGDMYAGLKTGTIEAAVSVAASTVNMKFYEVASHLSQTDHAITVRPFLMSGLTWSKLTPDQRKAVTEAAREATAVDRSLEAQDNEEALAEMKNKLGVKFYAFTDRDAMREKTQPVREKLARELKLEDMLADIEKEWDRTAHKKK